LRQIPAAQIRSRLETILAAEGVKFESAGLGAIAHAARGSLRDALSLLDQAVAHGAGQVSESSVAAMLGLVGREHLYRIVDALARRDGPAMLAQAEEMGAHGVSFEQALQELGALWHRIAVAQIVPGALVDDGQDDAAVRALAGRFSAEDVQLYYQIVAQGRADIVLAPDEHAGFTMTLLRMLAFSPTDEQSAEPQRVAQPAAQPKSVSAAPRRGTEASAASAITRESWVTLLSSIKVAGMARQLAQNCEWVGETDGVVDLRLADEFKHLLEKGPQERLRAAIEEHLGRAVRLRIDVGRPIGQTPAQMNEEQRRGQLASAARSLDDDPFVRELVEDLGARVVPDSIKLTQ
jgi:DNA polymerase-3 subunit gamma/tau